MPSPMQLPPYTPLGVSVEVRGLVDAQRMLARMSAEPIAAIATQEAADYLKMALAEYPPPPHPPYKLRFYTARQRRFVMWALRTGVISPPYKRTRRLARGWIVDVAWRGGREVRAKIVNIVEYTRWVMSDRLQAYMHRGYWPRISEVWRDERSEVLKIIRETTNAYIRKARGR